VCVLPKINCPLGKIKQDLYKKTEQEIYYIPLENTKKVVGNTAICAQQCRHQNGGTVKT
jgi:hypothetical protein